MKAIFLALTFTVLIVLACQYLLEFRLPGLVVILLYFGFYGCFLWLLSAPKRKQLREENPNGNEDWPLSGPLGKLGKPVGPCLFLAIFSVTQMLCLLNPFQLGQIFRQVQGNRRLRKQEKELGTDFSDYNVKGHYALPFRGEWLVYNGGITPESSHSWEMLVQRFAHDFVKVKDGFTRHRGRGTRLRDYYCYGCEILAAASGEVVSIQDGIADAPLVGFGVSDFTARTFFGNHVIIEHAPGEYGVYAHLIKNSICVEPGEDVRQGQVIGLCGHSGNSTEPHLHFHLQASPDKFKGMGLPLRFSQLIVNGEEKSDSLLQAGQRVENPPVEEGPTLVNQNTKTR